MSDPTSIRAELAELRRKLESLESLRDVLGDEAVEKAQAEVKARARALVETGGGPFVAGGVAVEGGDFVGHDKWQLWVERLYLGRPTDQVPPEALLQAYLRSLAAECRRLPLGVIDKEFMRASGEQPIPLPDIYVDLDVVAPARKDVEDERAWALRLVRGEGRERTPLLEAVAGSENGRAVLLGDPGSGKTTFVNYLSYLLATDSAALPEPLRGLLPVRLILREVAARHICADAPKGTAQMLWDGLEDDVAARLGGVAASRLLPVLQGRLLEEGGLIMLDGLDEVPEACRRRRTLLEAVQKLVDLLPRERSHFLVTARPYAYADEAWHLASFPILALAPFNEAQEKRFIERWYQAVRPMMGWNEETARDKGKRLHAALGERPYLADLASRPLLLTLMATLHSSWGQLPEDRAGLYEETVKLLLGRWQRAREVRGTGGELVVEPGISQVLGAGEERVRSALESLAFAIHKRQREEPEQREGPADISEGEVLVAFKPLLGSLEPDVLLNYLKNRAGLLVARREGVYAFPHRSFQEYLAACRLADQPRFAGRLQKLAWEDPAWWREFFLLGVGKAKQGGLGNAVSVVTVLLPESPWEVEEISDGHWHIAALAGQALVELRLAEKSEGQPHYEALLKRARRWLVRLLEGRHLAPRERAEAGDVLGKLGDPRFDPDFYFLPRRYRGEPEPLLGFVEVPAGPSLMGTREEDIPALLERFGGEREWYEDEVPEHPVYLPTFYIARYPVTVAQYSCFAEGGGYNTPGWWTPTGWAWRQGEWDSQVEDEDLRRWLSHRPLYLRNRPMWWEEQREHPNRPVVGVIWFEALAFCRWLTGRMQEARGKMQEAGGVPGGWKIRLPSEAEWEKAARGGLPPDGEDQGGAARHYPWGDEAWDSERANVYKSGVGHPTPVGMYPLGATSSGLLDMAGNVWEWTASLYQPYPCRPDDGREDPESEGSRVVRGGSWDYSRGFSRCAYRGGLIPVNFYDLGFRLVVVSIALCLGRQTPSFTDAGRRL